MDENKLLAQVEAFHRKQMAEKQQSVSSNFPDAEHKTKQQFMFWMILVQAVYYFKVFDSKKKPEQTMIEKT